MKIKLFIIFAVSFLFVGIVHSEERFFAVTALNEWGESAYSEEISADPDGQPVSLEWSASEGATKYNVYWGTETRTYGEPVETELTTHSFVAPKPPAGIMISLDGSITVLYPSP